MPLCVLLDYFRYVLLYRTRSSCAGFVLTSSPSVMT